VAKPINDAQKNRIVSLMEAVYEVCLARYAQTTPGSDERADEVVAQAVATGAFAMLAASDLPPEVALVMTEHSAQIAERLRAKVEERRGNILDGDLFGPRTHSKQRTRAAA